MAALLRAARPGAPRSNVDRTWKADAGALRRPLPFVLSPAPQAGFPSPATDYVEEVLDLHELLIRNAPATFYTRVAGDSLQDAGILDGDVIAVDRSLTPRSSAIVVATYDGEILVKRLRNKGQALALHSENSAKNYPPLPFEGHEVEVWGVVVGVVRKL